MSSLTLLDVVRRTQPPQPRAEGACIPWNDPGFSSRMLAVHLSQESDLASRRLSIIDAQVAWLDSELLGGQPGRVLDLGCGPGLYLHRLARRGHTGVGIDFGPASIAHARDVAEREQLDLRFVEADLRTVDFGEGFDLVTLIFGQLNVFTRAEAAELLRKAQRALCRGGRIVVEPQTFEAVRGSGETHTSWTTSERGLFSETPHLTLYEKAWNDAAHCSVERWFVIDAASGATTRHAQTTEAYAKPELVSLFEEAGFREVELLPQLPGSPDGEALCAVVAETKG